MTAEQIVETIRTWEHRYYIDLVQTEISYGVYSTRTTICRAKWAAVNNLCRELGIEDI